MKGISCFVNFKDNLNKNVPYYNLLMQKISGDDLKSLWIGEQAALSGNTVSKISEGYQFTIAFHGRLASEKAPKDELLSAGYHFLSEEDCELALLCYIHFGEKCVEKLCGEYSFIIYDSMRRQIFAVSGKDAKAPLFFGETHTGYVLSTSINGVLACPGVSANLSCQNILDLIAVKSHTSRCIFDKVFILMPGHSLKISATGISEKEFFKKNQEQTSAYEENSLTESIDFPVSFQHPPVDEGSIYYGLETSVLACGYPVLSDFDYILPHALRQAKGNDEVLYFPVPSKPQCTSYLSTLIKNDAFYSSLEKNFSDYSQSIGTFLNYPAIMADYFETEIKPLYYKEETPPKFNPFEVRTALRHILLDIISKEHAPILAFFRRSALLRLCEGGFTFSPGQSECQLTAYLIKLNMWFEKYHPRII